MLAGGVSVDYDAAIDRIPLFVRSGAIIPLQVSDGQAGHGGAGSAGWLTLLLYPDGESQRTLYPSDISQPITVSSRRDGTGTLVTVGRSSERYILRIKELERPASIALARDDATSTVPEMATFTDLEGATEGWFYDPSGRLRLGTPGDA